MKLEEIGFYTLEDNRAMNVNMTSPLWRCELVLTDRCNFKCPYCMGVAKEHSRDLTFNEACHVVDLWAEDGLKNIRFSGGEPTVWPNLLGLIWHTKSKGIERIAVSTNGSKPLDYYKKLLDGGVDDLSISLDACCSSVGDTMLGGIKGMWDRVVSNIRELSKLTYLSVGAVFTPENIEGFEETVKFASDDLGVSDVRIISAVQWNKELDVRKIPQEIIERHPILKYRVNNFLKGRNVRGISETDNHQCPLVIDDMAIMNMHHFPCIIHLRNYGDAIGQVDGSIKQIRRERFEWFENHDTSKDPICSKVCLDVCVDYNNRVKELNNNLWK